MSKKNSPNNTSWIVGKHTCLQALKDRASDIHKALITQKAFDNLPSHLLRSIPQTVASPADIAKVTGEQHHQGMALLIKESYFITLSDLLTDAHTKHTILAIDTIQDSQNLGAICRSSAAFDIDTILIPSAHIPGGAHWKKVASGALFHTRICPVTNMKDAMNKLKKIGFWCVGLAEEGNASATLDDPRLLMIVGGEEKGIRPLVRQNCDALMCIPTSKRFTTLNMAHACSIVLSQRFNYILHLPKHSP